MFTLAVVSEHWLRLCRETQEAYYDDDDTLQQRNIVTIERIRIRIRTLTRIVKRLADRQTTYLRVSHAFTPSQSERTYCCTSKASPCDSSMPLNSDTPAMFQTCERAIVHEPQIACITECTCS